MNIFKKRRCNNFSHLPEREALIARWEFQKYLFKDKEEWKTIPGFEVYQIGTASKIRHIESYHGKPKTLVQTIRDNRYFYVTLTSPCGKRVGLPVDKIMLITFTGEEIDKYKRITHIDNIKNNNRIENLRL